MPCGCSKGLLGEGDEAHAAGFPRAKELQRGRPSGPDGSSCSGGFVVLRYANLAKQAAMRADTCTREGGPVEPLYEMKQIKIAEKSLIDQSLIIISTIINWFQ